MSYTNLQLLRKMISDPLRRSYDRQEGDGETIIFKLTHGNIANDSFTVYIDGETKEEDTDYTIDQEEGVVTFTSVTPAAGKDVEVKYKYAAFSDTELEEFIELDGNVQSAALRCLDILLFDSARRFDYVSGQTEFKPSQVFDHLMRLREIIEKKVNNQDYGGGIIVKRKSRYYDNTAIASHDLSRDDLGD